MFHFPSTRSPANSGASESPGNTPGAALKKRSLKADLSPGSWRHHRRDAFDPYELLAKYELTSDGVEAGGKRRPLLNSLPVLSPWGGHPRTLLPSRAAGTPVAAL